VLAQATTRNGVATNGVATARHAAGIIEAVIARLRARPGRQPVLAVDDANLLDGASAALVHHLAAQHHVFAVLVLTSGVGAPDALRSLWKERLVRRVEVTALRPDDVEALLHGVLGGPLDGVSQHRMLRLCAGNLAVLRELVGATRASNALRQVAGVWRLVADRRVADRLCDAITDYFDVSDSRLRAVVEMVACAEPLPQLIVERAADRDVVVEAEQRGLITASPSGARVQVRISVPAYGAAVRARLPALARGAIWRRLVELHAELPHRRAEDVLTAAWWRVQAGIPVAPGDLVAAGQVATARLDFPTAEELFTKARAAGAGRRADLALAEIHHLRGRHNEAVAALPDGIDDGDPRPLVIRDAAAYWTAGVRPKQSGAGPVGAALGGAGSVRAGSDGATLDGAALDGAALDGAALDGAALDGAALDGAALDGAGADADADEDEEEDETVLAARTWPALLDGEVVAVLSRGTALLETAREPAAVVWAASSTVAAAGLRGDLALVERAYAAGLAAADQPSRAPLAQARLTAVRCLATLLTGSVRAAADQAQAGYNAAVRAELVPLAGLWAALRGVVAKAAGRIAPARQALHEAVALLGERDAYGFAPAVLAELAGAYAMSGDAVQARTWLDALQRCHRPAAPIFDAWIERNRAWVAVSRRDLPRAAAHALRAAELAERTQQPTVQAAALFDAARLGAATEARDRLGRIVRSLPNEGGALPDGTAGPMAAFADAATALAAEDPHALTVAGDTLCRLGFLLPAAELATTAYRLRALAGRQVAGQQALARARELLRDCPGADTPLLVVRQVRTLLTERELHVARLAADGLTGRAIAGRLGLSLRTVNNHLSRSYAKLGISGRAGLATVLAAQEEGP
jgi:DNA-binding CsgD family transcriptional regulator/uncharacterized protein YjbI with pentapeptide repeats